MRRKSCPDGILHGGGLHLQLEEEKKEVEVYLVPGVAAGAGAEVSVQKPSQD